MAHNNNQKAISIDYKYRKIHKKSKRQTQWNGFALIENDITTFELALKY
jgi:hypothetical protein